ncbi:MAG: helix-turn-helix domain-containing GNAT family N-acetyltransferase [Xanthomonadales bacterium]|nr:helix-turn-helix domain-containing GNAT family N-acetyltransferase [Xanthomonadales bacterium]
MHDETPAVRQAARVLVRELQLLDGQSRVEGFGISDCHFITELQALGEATASELAERLVLEKSTVSRLCRGLVTRGLVERLDDPSDGRKRLLRLTVSGEAAAERIHAAANRQVDDALGMVPAGARNEIVAGLERYARGLRYARLSAGFSIRPIRKRDNPRVARIIREVMTSYGAVGQGYSINDPEVDDMHGAYPASDSAFYVIERGGEVLGCGGIGPLRGAAKDVCELRKMYLLPEARGTGIGARLLEQCLASAIELGYRTCYLETLEHMTHARHLYGKYGFAAIDKPLGDTGHSACNHWMVKKLDDR